jgi:Tfp pilus assembly protein PilV
MKRAGKRIKVFKKNPERGALLIELMIAMLVLAIGLGALTTLIAACMATDTRNSKDTSATLLAQKVIEELSAQNTNSTSAVILTDCAGNSWTIPSTQGTAALTSRSRLALFRRVFPCNTWIATRTARKPRMTFAGM